ncbi:hypothetical protein LTR53_018412, partial [Teratosphaeriaceae sp. CCFEE 6253]
TDISVIVEEADGALSSHPPHDAEDDDDNDDNNDDEMSDADSEAADADGPHPHPHPTAQASAAALEAAAAQRHIAALETRRDRAVTQRIIAAWEQGRSLPPEIEQYLKEQSDRGTLRAINLRALLDTSRAHHGYALGAAGPAGGEPAAADSAAAGGVRRAAA